MTTEAQPTPRKPRQLTLSELDERYPITCSIDKKTGAVAIPMAWRDANLVSVKLLPWMPMATLHKDASPIFQRWFELIQKAGLTRCVVTYNGSFVPRLKRGPQVQPTRAGLSRHARGIALDLNAEWNRMGHQPAAIGQMGCLLELVPLANECGLVSGSDWRGSSIDGMHFEVGTFDAIAT
jgi:D-alanyl-D-alanine carboxypeptidase